MILSFTTVFGEKEWWDVPRENHFSEQDKPCQFNHCKLTYDKKLVGVSDAVLCHANELPTIQELRAARSSSNQLWVWMTSESPNSFQNRSFESYKNFFNWTGTYSRKADLLTPYFVIKPFTASEQKPDPLKIYAQGKDKMILVLMSSNCNSYRIKFIRALKKFVNVDLYGKCKDLVNPQLSDDCKLGTKDCDELKRRYKFTLSLESAYCKDYITEKFYYNGLIVGNVPVVMNRANMSNPKVAPPGSFINILDFKDVESLANHLKMLASNNDEYNKLHAWRQNYKVGTKNRMCTTCEALWKRDLLNLKDVKEIDIEKEWNYQRNCMSYENQIFTKYLN